MTQKILEFQVLGEHVRAVVDGGSVSHSDDTRGFELADLEEAAVDVPRPVAGLAVAGQLDGAGVVELRCRERERAGDGLS